MEPSNMDLEIRLLGPVEMQTSLREIPLGPPKQRCVFASLVLTPNRPVPLKTLLDRLWGIDPPEAAINNLYTYVARLRRLLRSGSSNRVEVIRNSTSYTLKIDPACVDIHRARALVRQAEAAVEAGQDGMASELYQQALQFWRGEPLCGLSGDWAELARAGLKRERLSALTGYFAAELRLGRHAQVIGELSTAVSEHPLDEALASQLMLCLYRSHRHAEALNVFHWIKAELANQLGIDPGPGLRQLHEELLRNDSSLQLPGKALDCPASA